jgi:copper(I)-binding protein
MLQRIKAKMKHLNRIMSLFGLVALACLSACGEPPKLRVDEAKLILSPVDSNPSGLYFTVHGGTEDVSLFRVVSDSAIRSEMHESGKDPETGAMTMTAQEKILIPAKSKVEFKQGGKHVMMWGVNLRARRLGEIPLEFVFSNGDRILVDAVVEEVDGTIPDERKAVT